MEQLYSREEILQDYYSRAEKTPDTLKGERLKRSSMIKNARKKFAHVVHNIITGLVLLTSFSFAAVGVSTYISINNMYNSLTNNGSDNLDNLKTIAEESSVGPLQEAISLYDNKGDIVTYLIVLPSIVFVIFLIWGIAGNVLIKNKL